MAPTKPRPPILPRDPADPTGADALERAAIKAMSARVRRVVRAYRDTLDRIPFAANAKSYTFQLDAAQLALLLDGAGLTADDVLLEGGVEHLWFFEQYVGPAYQRGTAQEFANLAQQSPAYKAGQRDVAGIIQSEPYRRRIALIKTREFEEMKGFSGSLKADLSRTLTDGLARGLNPKQIADNLVAQGLTDDARGARIARTEVTTALRRGRLDESDDAQERYGLRTMQMHLSALSPTTRASHAARHAKLFTVEQQRAWWAEGGNSINCKCSTTSVMVDAEGKPLVPIIQQRARENYRRMLEKSAKEPS